MNKAEKKHDNMVRNMNLHPKKLQFNNGRGIDELSDIVLAGTMNILEGGKLVAAPDGVMFDKWGNAYVLEYKSTDSTGNRHKAYDQLRKAAEGVYARGNILYHMPTKIYVHDDFEAEVV